MSASGHENQNFCSKKCVESTRAANVGGFGLNVVGSRGLGGIEEFFVGSVSDRVADDAKCPVLIVKESVNL